MSNQVVINTRNAFAYIQQLYTEVALLIQEVEDYLRCEIERFTIATPKGYNVVAMGSLGIESPNVKLWPLRKFSVFFVPEARTEANGGQTITKITEPVLYMRFLLDEYGTVSFAGRKFDEPTVMYGVFRDTERLHKTRFEKFEQVLSHIEYNADRVFAGLPNIDFKDSGIRLRGTFRDVPLFQLTDAKAIHEKLVVPSLHLFRQSDVGATKSPP